MSGLLAEPETAERLVELRLAEAEPDLGRADVRRHREDLRRREPLVDVRVVDGDVVDRHRPFLAVDGLRGATAFAPRAPTRA